MELGDDEFFRPHGPQISRPNPYHLEPSQDRGKQAVMTLIGHLKSGTSYTWKVQQVLTHLAAMINLPLCDIRDQLMWQVSAQERQVVE